MMKLIFCVMFFMFIVNKINKIYFQVIYQNFIILMFFLFIMILPMNSISMWFNLYYIVGIDYYSSGLILLSLWIISLMIISSNKIIQSINYKYYIYLINLMLIFLILCFSTLNLILFYIYFESSLIPVFLLIMGWGNQVERIHASFYLMLYTLLGSMPLFMIIIYIYLLEYTLMMDFMIIKISINFYVYISMIMAFLIKMPMYFVHLWLPKAHVEAPIMGSMILAGIMLKLGSYGLMRVMIMMMNLCLKFNKFIIIISLMGGLISSLICMCQIDLKMLVAYSSVVHMSILMAGMMTLFNWGFFGSYLMMISHGLCSSGLFCLVNINYERLLSRSLFINKGLINYFPSLSLMWFLMCSSNLSFPPSLNLFSEILLFNSLVIWNKLLMLILIFISFFSASYTLYMYSYSQHGKMNFLNYFIMNIYVSEFLLLLMHWFPLNLMFLLMNLFI